jgi:segregation and condensation protein B
LSKKKSRNKEPIVSGTEEQALPAEETLQEEIPEEAEKLEQEQENIPQKQPEQEAIQDPEQAPEPETEQEPGPQPVEEDVRQTQMPRIIEALLFATDEPLSIQKIKSILPYKPDVRKIKAAIEEINERLRNEQHPFEIVEVAGGYQFRTAQYYHNWIRQLFKERINRRLSQSGLETLAIIAYKQPLTKAEIEAVRGVNTDGALTTLLERRLIKIAGRSEKPGRPLLYDTTKDFLRHFGLNHIDDLPKLEEFERIARAQDDIVDSAPDMPLEDEHIEELNEAQAVGSFADEEMPLEDEFLEEPSKEDEADVFEMDDAAEDNRPQARPKDVPPDGDVEINDFHNTET